MRYYNSVTFLFIFIFLHPKRSRSHAQPERIERRIKVYDRSKRVFSWRKDVPLGAPVDDLSPEGDETHQNRQILAIKGEFPA